MARKCRTTTDHHALWKEEKSKQLLHEDYFLVERTPSSLSKKTPYNAYCKLTRVLQAAGVLMVFQPLKPSVVTAKAYYFNYIAQKNLTFKFA